MKQWLEKKKKVVFFTDSTLKTLRKGKFNSCIRWSQCSVKIIPLMQINTIRSSYNSNFIRKILDVAGNNLGICLIVHLKQSNDEIHYIIKIVSNCDLWKNGFHLLETCKTIIAKNLISNINYFLENTIPPISSF